MGMLGISGKINRKPVKREGRGGERVMLVLVYLSYNQGCRDESTY